MTGAAIQALLASAEPSIRWKVRIRVLGEDPDSRANRRLREEIRRSPRVQRLISAADPAVYRKWQGRHWALLSLAELGYPPGADELADLADKVAQVWLAPRYFREFDPTKGPTRDAVPVVAGTYRRCGSQHGGVLLALTRLGLAADAQPRLVERLIHWQWPDGGWNCRTSATTRMSSLNETWLPMRGLAAEGSADAMAAAHRAAQVLLERRVLFRRTDGTLISPSYPDLRFPAYWHYGLLPGLIGLAELGLLSDPRCADALDLLQAKRNPDGSWSADGRWYKGTTPHKSHHDVVGWGPTGRAGNEWVTVDALTVLAAADR